MWIFALVFSAQAFAAGDWVLTETPDLCTATTAARFSDRSVYYLDVIVDKTGVRPPEVMMRPKDSPSVVTSWRAPIDADTSFSFAALPWTTGEVQFFWQAPRATSELMSYLKRRNQFTVKAAAGATGQVTFSLRGSSATLNDMERKCGLLAEERFEQKFLPAEVQAFDVTLLTPDLTNTLRELLTEGFAAYKSIVLVEKELEQLEARFAALTRELAALRAEISTLQSEIVTTENRSRAAQAEIDRATQEIPVLRTQITDAQTRLATATQNLNAAQAALQPYVAEHDRLNANVRADRQRLSTARTELANADGRVQSAERRIADLERSVQFLRSQSDELQRALRRAREELAQAETQRLSFNPEREIRQRKQNDSRLARVTQQIQDTNQRLEQQKEVVRGTKLDLEVAQRLLRECTGRNGGQDDGDVIIIDKPSRQGKANRKLKPNENEEITPPDCEAQKQAVREARERHQSAVAELEVLRNQREELVGQRERIENRIETEVNREYDQLVQNEARARREVASVQSNLDANDRELRNIVQIDLPSAQSELNSALSARRSANDAVDSAERRVSDSVARLNQFKASVGYDALVAEVTRTSGIVDSIRAEIAALQKRVTANEAKITEQTTLRDRMNARLVTLNATLSTKQARESAVVAALAPYDQEKTVILAKLQAAEGVMAAVSVRYGDTLP